MVAPITQFGVFLRDTLAGHAVTYEEYRNAVLIAVVEAETYRRPALNLAGQIDVWQALRQAGLEVKENWIRDAVQNYEALGFFSRVLRPIRPPRIFLRVTEEGRRAAERLAGNAPG